MLALIVAFALQEQDESRTETNVRMLEIFDEARDPSHYRHARPAVYSGGTTRVTYDADCLWTGRRKPPLLIPQDDDQEEEPPEFTRPPVKTGTPFKDAGGGGKIQFPTTLGIPGIDVFSRIDGAAVDYDEIDTEALPGAHLSTTLTLWERFDVEIFLDYVTGRFDSTEKTTIIADVGRGPEPFVESFELEGDVWLLEIGVAPVLWRFEEGVFSGRFMPAAGVYFGRMQDMSVERSGLTSESIPVSDETLFGGFAGAIVRADVRLGRGWRIEIGGEFFRLFGDADGWSGLALLGFRIDF